GGPHGAGDRSGVAHPGLLDRPELPAVGGAGLHRLHRQPLLADRQALHLLRRPHAPSLLGALPAGDGAGPGPAPGQAGLPRRNASRPEERSGESDRKEDPLAIYLPRSWLVVLSRFGVVPSVRV